MAKAKAPAAATPSEWKHKVIAAVEPAGTSVVWKAQKSIAPDGKKFVGIRKFAVKKDGTEQVTNAGLSLLFSPEGLHKVEIQGIISLLEGFL